MDRLVLRGMAGIVAGHEVRLEPGKDLLVGRSRAADLSLRRCLPREDPEVLGEREFLRISRRHFLLRFRAPDHVEVQDLSLNGTYVDGRLVKRVVIRDLRSRPAEIHMGGRDRFVLEWDRGHDGREG